MYQSSTHNVSISRERDTEDCIPALLGFPEPKWNSTFVLLTKGHPIKRRGHPHHKQGPLLLKVGDLTPTGTEELKSNASMNILLFANRPELVSLSRF